jgi:Ca-activated chloride channel family protein
MSAVVHKANGQPVINLTSKDFELVDTGRPRPITDFRSEAAPVTIAILADTSGSMDVAAKLEAARAAAGHILAWLAPGSDQVGLFTFDTRLHQIEQVGPAPGTIMKSLESVKPFGSTSLFDAVAETGRRLAAMGSTRRAVVALTDGGDNASRLTAGEVSGIASEIDVPVYIVVVISPFDHAAATTAEDRASYEQYASGRLGDLARWTGGALFIAATPAQASAMARQIVSELRHQYLIAFEPDTKPGWHPIELKTKQSDLIVRARSGYVVRNTPELR